MILHYIIFLKKHSINKCPINVHKSDGTILEYVNVHLSVAQLCPPFCTAQNDKHSNYD